MIVISDGQRFGNIITASYQKLHENVDEMMMMDSELNDNQDHLNQDDEDYNIEYNSHLLLGDRDLSKWLELFA